MIPYSSPTNDIGDLAYVNNEIWVTAARSGNIARYDLSGSLIDVFNSPSGEGASAQVGNEVWIASGLAGTISRHDFSGAFLGNYSNPTGFGAADVITVGNDVWIGDTNTGLIARFDFSGSFIDTFSSPNGDIGKMATIVPIPPAADLFGSGLIGLAGIAKRRVQS